MLRRHCRIANYFRLQPSRNAANENAAAVFTSAVESSPAVLAAGGLSMETRTLLLMLLAGCASRGQILDMGNGKYSLLASGMSMARARESATAGANEYCAKSGKSAAIDTFDDKTFSSSWGGPTASVVFSCR